MQTIQLYNSKVAEKLEGVLSRPHPIYIIIKQENC